MAVEFNEENNFNKTYQNTNTSSSSGLTNWVIKKGIAKDEQGAKNLMTIVTIVCFALSIYFFIK